jgi:hypothetical protein
MRSSRAHVVVLLGAAVLLGTAATARGAAGAGSPRVVFRSPVIDLFQSSRVTVGGITARRAEVRLLGAIDRSGRAYEWTPYPWRRLRPDHGTWRGALPSPALFGIYEVQLRLDGGTLLDSPRWLLRVFPHGIMRRPSSRTAGGAVRRFVAHLPGDQVLVAVRRWSLAAFDHRNPRLHRLFAIAYEHRGDHRRRSRVGLFVTTVRDGFHGRWRVLESTVGPYD